MILPECFFDLQNVVHTYMPGTPFEKRALQGVDLRVERGECLGIVGSTGSGKSTLVQHLNGLLRCDSGSVFVDGIAIPSSSRRGQFSAVRFAVGLLFQFPEQQLFEETVFDDVAFGPRNMKLGSQEVEERVDWALELVGLDPRVFGQKSPFNLSGGEKRRVALAGVLSMRPKCLVLDEPTAGLDPHGTKELIKLLHNLREHLQLTLVVVSHRFEELAQLVDRIVVLSGGQVYGDGPVRDILYNRELLRGAGLAIPELSNLFLELAARGADITARPLCVDEAEKALLGCWKRNI